MGVSMASNVAAVVALSLGMWMPRGVSAGDPGVVGASAVAVPWS